MSGALVPVAASAGVHVDDRTDILRLYRDFVTQQSDHLQVLRDPAREEEAIELAPGGGPAIARFHCLVENATPLTGDATVLEMARQQGLHAERWWESGIHELRYTKTDGAWHIETAWYRRLHAILPITR